MNQIARTETKFAALSLSWTLPALLAANTFALLALDRMGGIPTWIKSAAALFLSF